MVTNKIMFNRLRASVSYIPELALITEENGKIVGHIILSRTYVAASCSKQIFEANFYTKGYSII
ncbi:MAG: hypothetical protein WHU54_07630 [Candidatus Bathyarchaeia archaeon]